MGDLSEMATYYSQREELTIQDGCLLWGIHVIVLQKLQQRVLNKLHESYMGVVKIDSLARSYAWLPHIDEDIKLTCKGCTGCQITLENPSVATLHWLAPL